MYKYRQVTILATIEISGFSSNDEPLTGLVDGISLFIYEDDGGVPSSNPAMFGETFIDFPLKILESNSCYFIDDGPGMSRNDNFIRLK